MSVPFRRAGKIVLGMVHVGALPGTPHARAAVREVIDRAAAEAGQLVAAGFDGVIIENMHDRPYLLREVGPEIVAGMAAVGRAVRERVPGVLGVQILAGANQAALAVAQVCSADFIRAEGFVFAHVADEGWMAEADAGRLLRYRHHIGADGIAIFADIKKKHASHAVTADIDLVETAHAAVFCGADGLVVTGTATGRPANAQEAAAVSAAVTAPVAVGSGLGPANLARFWPVADVFIIGSALKDGGHWAHPLDPERVAACMHAVAACRQA